MVNISSVTTQTLIASTPLVSSPSVSGAPQRVAQQAPAQQASVQGTSQPVSERDVQQAVSRANQMLASQGANESVVFSYEEKLDQVVVKILDQNTGKVVREIPSRDFVRQQLAIREMIGMILDKKA